MRRLHHSFAGHLRSMQLSATQMFVFVEGKQCDPYFFAKICSTAVDHHTAYEVSTARQLPGDTGGKQALMAFFVFLRTRKSLITDFAGRRTTCVFFLDKDIDDLQRAKKRSPHVVYTEHYDVENYVFQHGDLVKGSAAAASIDPRKLQSAFGNAPRWCQNVATMWRDWIGLCLRLIEDDIRCEANYRVLSRVQKRLCGPTDPPLLSSLTRDIARRAHLPVAELRRRLGASTKKVDRYFARAEHHRLFKGKWFSAILADDIDRIMAGDPYDSNGLSERLPCTIAATLDFCEPWADYFRQSLHDIAAML